MRYGSTVEYYTTQRDSIEILKGKQKIYKDETLIRGVPMDLVEGKWVGHRDRLTTANLVPT